MGRLQVSRLISASAERVFHYVSDLKNLSESLLGVIETKIPLPPSELGKGVEFELLMTRFGLTRPVRFRVEDWVPNERFTYRQVGPGVFRAWKHTEILSARGLRETLITDLVEFSLPFGLVGAVIDDLIVRHDFSRLLKRRQAHIEDMIGKRERGHVHAEALS
jgi:ligand-binding SRPBCC domain-containing protein